MDKSNLNNGDNRALAFRGGEEFYEADNEVPLTQEVLRSPSHCFDGLNTNPRLLVNDYEKHQRILDWVNVARTFPNNEQEQMQNCGGLPPFTRGCYYKQSEQGSTKSSFSSVSAFRPPVSTKDLHAPAPRIQQHRNEETRENLDMDVGQEPQCEREKDQEGTIFGSWSDVGSGLHALDADLLDCENQQEQATDTGVYSHEQFNERGKKLLCFVYRCN